MKKQVAIMIQLIDKVILLIVCSAFFLPNAGETGIIPPILIVVILSAAGSYFDHRRIRLFAFLIHLGLAVYEPSFCFFLPLLCYDVMLEDYPWLFLLGLLPLAVNHFIFFSVLGFFILSLGIIAYLLKHRTVKLLALEQKYYLLTDTSKEVSLQLESKNKELMEKQDYEINLATLNERNRIARDIHDNVGHLLSRSLLQIGAVLATTQEESTKEQIGTVKDTLSQAMDSIRNSVHNLHEESIDLRTEIESLLRAFTFCPVHLEYEIQSALDKNLKYCFIAITKEALSNISRHSNATHASVLLLEHPALFQLVIQDNGSNPAIRNESGIGLKNIADRVEALQGNLNISGEKGFRIFISIPKSKPQSTKL